VHTGGPLRAVRAALSPPPGGRREGHKFGVEKWERIMVLLLKLAALGSLVLLFISIYPGVLADVIFIGILLFPLWLPALGIGGLILLMMRDQSVGKKPVESDPNLIDEGIGGGKGPVFRRCWVVCAPVIVILSFGLIPTGIPRHIAFYLSQPAFQKYVSTAPVSEYQDKALGRLLGFYYVDRYGADPSGGVYFRTHSGADGIGPDIMSYGFAFRPNPEETSFGRAGYCYSHVVGDWYVFSASNDY
jgi:hypothetical protein